MPASRGQSGLPRRGLCRGHAIGTAPPPSAFARPPRRGYNATSTRTGAEGRVEKGAWSARAFPSSSAGRSPRKHLILRAQWQPRERPFEHAEHSEHPRENEEEIDPDDVETRRLKQKASLPWENHPGVPI